MMGTWRRTRASVCFVSVGDVERDDCIEYLVENHVAGRLSREEFEVRHAAAHRQ